MKNLSFICTMLAMLSFLVAMIFLWLDHKRRKRAFDDGFKEGEKKSNEHGFECGYKQGHAKGYEESKSKGREEGRKIGEFVNGQGPFWGKSPVQIYQEGHISGFNVAMLDKEDVRKESFDAGFKKGKDEGIQEGATIQREQVKRAMRESRQFGYHEGFIAGQEKEKKEQFSRIRERNSRQEKVNRILKK